MDSALLILILLVLLLVNTGMALSTFLFFGLFTYVLYRVVRNYSASLGETFQRSSIEGRESLSTIFMGYREIFTSRKSNYFINIFRKARTQNTSSNANAMWLQFIPKATAEIGLVIGAGGLVIYQAWQNSASGGLGIILLFLASASRLTPALIRIQGSFIYMKNYASAAIVTLEILEDLKTFVPRKITNQQTSISRSSSPIQIKIENLSFRFPDSATEVLNEISFEVEAGSISAIAGPSGSGKTTLVDLIIGIYSPNKGKILFKEVSSDSWKNSSEIKIAYVPQAPYLISGTMQENIAIGVDLKDIDVSLMELVIKICQLSDFFDKLPDGLNTQLGGISSRVSGGEKQRLALARALYSQPDLLIIDEGTSSLDAVSERNITDYLMSLSGEVTVLLIAHRLAAIRGAQTIYFLESGTLKGQGNFAELEQTVPGFAEQIKLMELR